MRFFCCFSVEMEVKEMALTELEKEEIKKARREYKKEWRKNNPDKVKAANERYWLKKAVEKRAKEEVRNNGD